MTEKKNKIKKYTLFSFSLFTLFAIFGFLFNYSNPQEADLFFSSLEQEFSFIEDFNFFRTFLFLFVNNTITVAIGAFLGVLFSILPLFILAVNGFVIGLVAGYVYPTFGLLGLILSLAPHGVFELTALFVGMGSGIYLGISAINEVRNNNLGFGRLFKSIRRLNAPSEKIKEDYEYVFNLFLKLVIPLLFLAAVIEALLILML